MIDIIRKIIFIHIPKTAGTSMENTKVIASARHIPLRQVKALLDTHIIGLRYRDCFSFSFVRNPWERLLVAYFWHRDIQGWSRDFNEFVSFLTPRYLTKRTVLKTQKHWLWCRKDIPLSFLGRFENLENDWHKVCEHIGVYEKLPHLKRFDGDYHDFYDSKSIDKVSSLYADDIRLFGYKY